MPQVPKFTKEQKLEVALELISGKLSHAEVCRKHGISSTYAYKLKDRALELLRQGIDQANGRASGREADLKRRVEELEQLAGDQALTIRALKKTKGWN
jgi:transposase-like protein